MRYFFLTFIFLTITFSVFSQTLQQIMLKDKHTQRAIVGATWQYGNQRGVTGIQGIIEFGFRAETKMVISHISYGTWEWESGQLKSLIEAEVFFPEKRQMSLYPVTIISIRPGKAREEVKLDYTQKLAHDGAALLGQVTGISNIRKSGAYGFDPVFRGFKYDRLNIVFDGVQNASAACPNRMDPPTSQMAPNMTDRIEVLKGPYALRYGSGFGATINYLPERLTFSADRELEGRVSTAYESNGRIFRSEGQISARGERFDLGVFAAWSQGDDYTSGNGEEVNAGFLRNSFGTHLGLKISEHQDLRISALYNMARDADFAALPMDLREDDTWMINLNHKAEFRKRSLQNWETALFGSFVDHKMDNLLKDLDPRMVNAVTQANTLNYGGRTQTTWFIRGGRLYAGLDYRSEEADGTRTREFLMGPNSGKTLYDNVWQDSRIMRGGLFGEYQLLKGSLNFVFSTRFELNQSEIRDIAPEFPEDPSAEKRQQLNTSFSTGIQQVFRGGVKTGFWIGRVQRSGSLTERFINYFPVGQDPYEIVGNPRLRPETNNQADLVFNWSRERITLDLDIFISLMEDYISSVIDTSLSPRVPASPGVRKYRNIGNAFKTGFEFRIGMELPFQLEQRIDIALTYAEDLKHKQPLPEIPPMEIIYSLKGDYLGSKFHPSLSFRYAAEQSRISEEYGETLTPSFLVADFRMEYRIRDFLKLNAALFNLFNENYYEHLNRSVLGTQNRIYAPGRSILAGFSLQF